MKLIYIRYLIDMKAIGILFNTILFLTSSAYSANLLTMDENSLVEHNSIEAIVATNAQTDECLLSVAHLGKYSSIHELKTSDSYGTLCEHYPTLASIEELSVDTHEGDLWLFQCLLGSTIAINQLSADGVGQVYYRSEEVKSIVIRFSAEVPGSIHVNVVGANGNVLIWVPLLNSATNRLEESTGVIDMTIVE